MTFDPGVGTTRTSAAKNQARKAGRGPRASAFIALAILVAAMWVLEGIDTVLGGRLDAEGVRPLNTDGLTGILLAPLLHAGWGHLIANTVPLLVVGAIIALDEACTQACSRHPGMTVSERMGGWANGADRFGPDLPGTGFHWASCIITARSNCGPASGIAALSPLAVSG